MYVHNWHKWQMHRKDRAQPPYIKLHRIVLRDESWAQLSDAEKGQLVSLWIVAADRDGVLPSDKKILKKIAGLDSEPDIERFQALGFLDTCQPDANMTPTWRQGDANMTPDGCQMVAKGKEREGKEREGREAPPAAPAAQDPPTVAEASPKQIAFARSLLEPHGLTLEDWMATAEVETFASHHLDLLKAVYKGKEPQPPESKRAGMATLVGELEFIAAEDGIEAAREWIGTQDAANRPPLWRRLDAIRQQEGAA